MSFFVWVRALLQVVCLADRVCFPEYRDRPILHLKSGVCKYLFFWAAFFFKAAYCEIPLISSLNKKICSPEIQGPYSTTIFPLINSELWYLWLLQPSEKQTVLSCDSRVRTSQGFLTRSLKLRCRNYIEISSRDKQHRNPVCVMRIVLRFDKQVDQMNTCSIQLCLN